MVWSALRAVAAGLCAVILVICLAPAVARGQTVANPRIVEFEPSSDHDGRHPNGEPRVSRYELEIYYQGASSPFQTIPIGKPQPDANGLIRYNFSGTLTGWALPGPTYEARVAAVGHGGRRRSTPSNPFVFASATCSYTVAPASVALGAMASSSSVSIAVTNASGTCTWRVESSASWLTPSVTSGSGSGTVTFSATANPSNSPRTARLTVSGTVVTVTQQGTCNYSVTPTSVRLADGAGTSQVTLNTASGCSWQVRSTASWLTPAVRAGTGRATVSFAVTPNPSRAARSARLTIGGETVTVTQGGDCDFSVSPGRVTLAAGAVSTRIAVTTTAGCSWQVTGNAAWLTPGVTSGSGAGTVVFSVRANDSSVSRRAVLRIASRAVTVVQLAIPSADDDSDGDGMPDAWETAFGLDMGNARDARTDPDNDGISSLDEYARGTHPRGFITRYFAEGASNGFFQTRFALLHTGTGTARVLMRFLSSDGTRVSHALQIEGRRRATVDMASIAGLDGADFATIVESDAPIVADRTMTWNRGVGSHAETAVTAPALTWYLAEGATHGAFDLFYLLQNPNERDAEVRIRYLRPSSPPLVQTVRVGALRRRTIWVDQAEIPAGSGSHPLASTDVSAVVEVTNGQPIIVERAMYFSRGSEAFTAGHESAGVTQASTRWFFAEGATGPFFDLYLLLANPSGSDAHVRTTYLLPDGQTLEKQYLVGSNSRRTVSVDTEEFPAGSGRRLLENATVSLVVESRNGVPIVAERSMWFPGSPMGGWTEAHNSPGATTTATRWAVADGEAGGPAGHQTYVLIANTSPVPGSARVTVVFEDGTSAVRTMALPRSSRTNVNIAAQFEGALGRRFGVIVESLGDRPVDLVVERSMYSNAGGKVWAAGTCELGTPLR